MRKPLVSVLIPVYNVEDYLERCLDSVLNQSLTNIEVICVNDGSTDDSEKILKKYEKKDHRIVVVNKENGGLPSARNAGLNAARGEYVGFVDSDDYVELDMFRVLYETAVRENSEVVICGANIFPEEPHANDWLYTCLSPVYQHYDQFVPELLYENSFSTPFLWRTFIKRSLLEENNLRLDESILIGEDKAFQAKVYPKAKGITIIPDKLYHYCWYREGSMMNQDVYRISDKKIRAHCKLVASIAAVKIDSEIKEENEIHFLKWGIPFLYRDFIYQPLSIKKELGSQITKIFTDKGYYRHKRKLDTWIVEQFDYFNEVAKEKPVAPKVSVIMPVNGKNEYVEETLKSILNQSMKELECIIVNNGGTNETYTILHHYLFKDKRVRLYNAESKVKYADALNYGLQMAKGEYVTFCETDGWYVDEDVLKTWYDTAQNTNADICGGIPLKYENSSFVKNKNYENIIGKADSKNCIENEFNQILYSSKFLKKNKLSFKDESVMTGTLFMLEAYMAANKKSIMNKGCYVQRHLYHPDWIATEKCEKILEAIVKIMELSVEKQDADIQARCLYILNGDYFRKIIINNTRAYYMSPEERPNGENSQIKIITHLYNIMQHVRPELLEKGGYSLEGNYTAILCELIEERHKFMEGLSERYRWY